MATVVSEYETFPYQRTSEQLFGIEEKSSPSRPEIENKRVRAEITEDMGNALDQRFREALRRDPWQKMEWSVLINLDKGVETIHCFLQNFNMLTIKREILELVDLACKYHFRFNTLNMSN